MRILIVKLSSIGDIVHTLPALAAIKRALPDSEVHWAADARASAVLQHNPLLSGLIEVNTRSLRRKSVLGKTIGTARRQLRNLRASGFDLSIDFQGLLKSATLARLAGVPFRAGFSRTELREPASRHLLTHTIEVPARTNVILRNIELAEKALGEFQNDKNFTLDRETIEFPISIEQEHTEEADEISGLFENDFAILNPAGGWKTKLWPAENYGALADRIWEEFGLESLICTAPNETDLAKAAALASRSGRSRSATPSLKGFYAIARRAKVYVGGDTGPTHLAVAAKCPVVGIFGPTEWWRNGSPFKEDLEVGRDDIDCRIDCHRRKCGNWICMEIPVDKVLLGIRTRLGL
ncbi:MAG: lipopolysaccharide heptosyltransferase I [Pyrinomonadaceae bacterium]|nr:lipopolysaccharide heptosyltransferase I [Pyrinomonadaceae bacterium]